MVTAADIKQLRDKTGVSFAQCKKALEDADGDMDKAIALLKEKSKDIAAKKSDRSFGAGCIASYVHSNGMVGALVELVCETDFVSKNDEFRTLARDIAMQVTASDPAMLIKEGETFPLLAEPAIKNPELTVGGLIEAATQKFGEKIALARASRFSVLES